MSQSNQMEETSFVESEAHSNEARNFIESKEKDELPAAGDVEEVVTPSIEARDTSTLSDQDHQEIKQDETSEASSSKEESISIEKHHESPSDDVPSHQFQEETSPTEEGKSSDQMKLPEKSHASGDHIHDERKPDDIEPEMKKVIVQEMTEESVPPQLPVAPPKKEITGKENKIAHSANVKPAPQLRQNAAAAASKPSSTLAKKADQKFSAPLKPTTGEAKKPISNNKVAAKPAPFRSSGPVTEKKPVAAPSKPWTASTKATSARPLNTAVRPSSTERKPYVPPPSTRRSVVPSSGARRTPSNTPNSAPKAPSTAPPRAMSATRAFSASSKTENAVHVTPKNKKYENIQGKVNASSDYTPGGGNVKIFHEKPKFNVSSKIGSLQNATHTPGGGQIKIESRKFNFKENAKPKIDAKSDLQSPHVEKKILTQKLEWKAAPKVGSLANANHKPTGGDVKIFNQKIKVDAAQSKVGSLDNANHKPAGGNVNIKEYKVGTNGQSSSNSVASHSNENSRRASATRNRMPGCHDPITAEEALGRN